MGDSLGLAIDHPNDLAHFADRIADRSKARLGGPAGRRPLHVEGYNRGQWVLLDYGDFVVHIFQEEPRRFYSLERLWGDAPDVTGDFRP